MTRSITLGLLMVVVVGCDGSTAVDAGAPIVDSGAHDGGAADAGPSDAGPSDAGTSDAGSTDAGSTDAGLTDAGLTDAGMSLPIDAGRVRTPAEICTSTCNRLSACGFGGPAEVAECLRDCTPDLGDCSDAELLAADACHAAPDACELTMVDGPPKLLECLARLACVSV